jgi:hypothetical protein
MNGLSMAGAMGSVLIALFLLLQWSSRGDSLNLIAAALLLVLAARMLLVRVEARTNVLKVVNPYHTYRISWSNISSFQMGRYIGDEGSSPLGFVVRRQGKPIVMFGVREEHQIDELNARLEHVQLE